MFWRGTAGLGKGCKCSRRRIFGCVTSCTDARDEGTSMKQATYTIRGTTPLLMHSERLANPFDPLTREIKALTGKRKKTEDDMREIARLEWRGGLYFDERDGIHIPGYNVFAALINGGKIHKLGSAIKRYAIVQEDKAPLSYDGPKTPDEMFSAGRWVDIRSVKVGTNKVMRCRPIFPEWQCTFTLLYDEGGLQRADIDRVVSDTGSMVGIGDYRPRFGRFEVIQ